MVVCWLHTKNNTSSCASSSSSKFQNCFSASHYSTTGLRLATARSTCTYQLRPCQSGWLSHALTSISFRRIPDGSSFLVLYCTTGFISFAMVVPNLGKEAHQISLFPHPFSLWRKSRLRLFNDLSIFHEEREPARNFPILCERRGFGQEGLSPSSSSIITR